MKPILRGVPASQGLAVGRAARVGEGEPDRVGERGTPVVLVAPAASPWLRSLVLGARMELTVSAIVAERGGCLSALATLARELGVPAVLGVGDELASVRDGERILVDGGTGVVYRLCQAESCVGAGWASAPGTV